ncbi:MAG: hypothetical protein DDT19_01050 [Syntrophomonadaceae bacterium]|nr:hypothetical protein [Bacillota bacterium]
MALPVLAAVGNVAMKGVQVAQVAVKSAAKTTGKAVSSTVKSSAKGKGKGFNLDAVKKFMNKAGNSESSQSEDKKEAAKQYFEGNVSSLMKVVGKSSMDSVKRMKNIATIVKAPALAANVIPKMAKSMGMSR